MCAVLCACSVNWTVNYTELFEDYSHDRLSWMAPLEIVLSNSPAPSRVSQSRLLKTVSRQVLNTSKDKDSRTGWLF